MFKVAGSQVAARTLLSSAPRSSHALSTALGIRARSAGRVGGIVDVKTLDQVIRTSQLWNKKDQK